MRRAGCVLFAWLLFAPALAQDTVRLHSVEISAPRLNLSHTGKKLDRIDSSLRAPFLFQPVSEAIAFNSPVFIKTNGPGQVATTSMRGGSAEQTAILWEGFNLQNTMLGLTDLSLIPAMMFDETAIEYGGSASVWGSGAIGGSIQLGNRLRPGAPLHVHMAGGTGSFGQTPIAAGVSGGGSRSVGSMKAFANVSPNRYRYLAADSTAIQQHEAYAVTGVLPEFRFQLNSKNVAGAGLWIGESNRDMTFGGSRSFQNDQTLRAYSGWSYYGDKYDAQLRGAFFSERISYKDLQLNQTYNSSVQTLIAEHFSYLRIGKVNAHGGVYLTNSDVKSDNYQSETGRSAAAALAGVMFPAIKNKLLFAGAARIERFSTGETPFTASGAAEFKPVRSVTIKLSAAKVYRQPTLNELYWMPGGNPDLKAESGYSFDGYAGYRSQIGERTVFSADGAAYSRMIDNWILWLPGVMGNPTPLNVLKVWSRGTETTFEFGSIHRDWRFRLRTVTGYNLSTIAASSLGGDETGRQLIHTPRYSGSGSFIVSFRKTSLTAFLQYTGYRFTASDHSAWLAPYRQSLVRLTHTFNKKNWSFTLFGACHNVLNENYVIMPGRPMPLRNYEAGLQIHFQKPSKS